MAEIQITTTQNVNIYFKAAEAGERILAYFIDFVVKGAYIGLLIWVLKVSGFGDYLIDNFGDKKPWSMTAIVIVLTSPVNFYTLVLESLLGGQTIGKYLVKIQVVKIDAYKVGFLDFFIRWVLRMIEVFPMGIIALITIGSSEKQQRLGGIASGTAVISKKNKVNIDHTILQELSEDYKPTYFSVIKLSDNDMRIVKENFDRAKKKGDHKTILRIKEKVIAVIEEKPDEDVTAIQFIETLIKDFNYFTKNM